jgi:MFS family permease
VLILGRLLVGIAIGWSGFSVAVYVTEVAPPAVRASMVAVNELALCTGCLLAFLAGWLLEGSWRWMFAAIVPAAAVLGLGT